MELGRSREGAWIEIDTIAGNGSNGQGRSREGAWIEIRPARQAGRPRPRRSREGAWIEMPMSVLNLVPLMVAPARERGLKY